MAEGSSEVSGGMAGGGGGVEKGAVVSEEGEALSLRP